MGRRVSFYFARGLLVLVAALFLWNAWHSIRLMMDWYSPLPLRDYWQNLPAYSSPHWISFWRQQNEHRILFPELVFTADTKLFRGRMILPLVCSALCYLGIWGTLIWAAYSRKAIASPLREIAMLLAGAVMFWQGCIAVLATPFQLSFTLLQFAVSLSFVFLAKLYETQNLVYVASISAAAIVATYSLAGGIMLWPILMAGAVMLKINWRQVAAIAICGAVAVAAYFIDYRPRGNLDIGPLLLHPAYVAEFVTSYLGMPFGSATDAAGRRLGFVAGALSLAIFGCCVAIAIRKNEWKSRLGILIFGGYVYTLLTALITAAGRYELSNPYFTSAKAPRYVTVPMAAWAMLVLATVWLVPKTRGLRLTLPMTLVGVVLVFIGGINAKEFVEKAAQDFSEVQLSALMLRNNLEDETRLLTIFPNAEIVKRDVDELRMNRLSIYAHGTDTWVGRDLKSLWPFSQPVPGQITRVYPIEGGLEIYGWSDSPFLEDEHAVLFVDQDGKIVGFGKRPRAGFPLGFGTWDTPPAMAFVGFVRLNSSVQSLSAYVWAHPDKTLHKMGEPIAIPNFVPAAAAPSGIPLPTLVWQMDPAFHLNGHLVSAENGTAPVGRIYGSFGSRKTGELRSDALSVPANHCLVLSVLHGISAYGQSVRLINADTNQEIAAVPMFDGRSLWERWRINIPTDVTRVSAIARDAGDGDNQWLAVADLAACR